MPAAAYLTCAAIVTRLRFADAPVGRLQRAPFRRSAVQGLKFTVSQPILRALFLSTMTINSANMFVNTAHVVFVVTVLQISVATAALLGVLQAVGALLGSLASGPVVRRLGIGRTKMMGALLMMPAVASCLPASGDLVYPRCTSPPRTFPGASSSSSRAWPMRASPPDSHRRRC